MKINHKVIPQVIWSVPDFSECGLGCDSCECAMPFVPLGWGEVSQV